MEHKVDEIFDFFGTKIKCVDSKNRHCSDCFLFDFAACDDFKNRKSVPRLTVVLGKEKPP